MTGLGNTLIHLARVREIREAAIALPRTATTLMRVADFGSNPGALQMLAHVPPALPPRAPLVVVLHGCSQTAAAYDRGAGWSVLADRHKFALLLPQQTRANNASLCFNWFQPADVARQGGEAQSILQGVAHMVSSHRLNPSRVYVTGLSAGGAMTASLLAAYPEVFAGGAVIAGLPHGAAKSANDAFEAMYQGRTHTARQWGDLVRAASSHAGPWPPMQVWHGTADSTVKPSNATELVKQWADVHGLASSPSVRDRVDGAAHEAWRGPDGRIVLQSYLVPGLGHGTPLDTRNRDLDHSAGQTGPHMLEAGVASTWHIARSWGLLTTEVRASVA